MKRREREGKRDGRKEEGKGVEGGKGEKFTRMK